MRARGSLAWIHILRALRDPVNEEIYPRGLSSALPPPLYRKEGNLSHIPVTVPVENRIESTFPNTEGRVRHRSFTFSPSATGIGDYQERDVVDGEGEAETRIRLWV